jgi:hypothetical protein
MKKIIGISILALLVAAPVYACLYCIPCPDGQEVCASASYPCVCTRFGECVGYRCPGGDVGEICCYKVQSPTNNSGNTSQGRVWKVLLSNGSFIYERPKSVGPKFDPLAIFNTGIIRLTSKRTGKRLVAVTANEVVN